jgi:hypothetical protein
MAVPAPLAPRRSGGSGAVVRHVRLRRLTAPFTLVRRPDRRRARPPGTGKCAVGVKRALAAPPRLALNGGFRAIVEAPQCRCPPHGNRTLPPLGDRAGPLGLLPAPGLAQCVPQCRRRQLQRRGEAVQRGRLYADRARIELDHGGNRDTGALGQVLESKPAGGSELVERHDAR